MEKQFFWKDKSGRGESATIPEANLWGSDGQESYDGIKLMDWVETAEVGATWENATDYYIRTQ